MTGEFFSDILRKMNIKLIRENRSIVLFIDNCKAHPVVSLSNMKVICLPPNTTSVLQPMDAGIIKCFKGYYRTKMARYLIKSLDKDVVVKQNSV